MKQTYERRSYRDTIKQEALKLLKQEQSVVHIAEKMNVSISTLYYWKRKEESDNQKRIEQMRSNSQEFDDRLKEEVLRLISSGQSVSLVASLLNISNMVLNGQLCHKEFDQESEVSMKEVDKRRKYSDDFKIMALQKSDAGVSIHELSKLLGVSEVTLYNWKEEAQINNSATNSRNSYILKQVSHLSPDMGHMQDFSQKEAHKFVRDDLTSLNVLDNPRINKVSNLLKVINNPVRIKIILLLIEQPSINVTSLQSQLMIGQASLSRHLIKLKDGRILNSARQGKSIYYYLKDPILSHFIKSLLALE